MSGYKNLTRYNDHDKERNREYFGHGGGGHGGGGHHGGGGRGGWGGRGWGGTTRFLGGNQGVASIYDAVWPPYYYDYGNYTCTPLNYNPDDTGLSCCPSLKRCYKNWGNANGYAKCINNSENC